jgi:sugar phosphate isomerase/epimerase
MIALKGAKMKLQRVRHLWGTELPWESVFPKIKAEDFAAIETALPTAENAGRWSDLLKEHGFAFIAMAFTNGPDVKSHVRSFRSQIEQAVKIGARQLTCHSGVDAFSAADANAYFGEVLAIEQSVGLPVAHETHRGRLLFSPWQARDLLEAHPAIKLCADFSHWVCVAERLLTGCEEIIALAASRTLHIHARVGFEEGPQVTDPRAPEWEGHVKAHEAWWDQIWDAQEKNGTEISTLTTEFGPPGYIHTLPYTRQPVANLWDICKWMADRQSARFAARGK